MLFEQNFNAQEVYEDTVRNGEVFRTIDGEDYIDIDIVEFDKVDDKFMKWIKNNLCDCDYLKGSDIFEVKPVK
ncbi:hypothetical protein IAQ67_15955 [Paenibacillus peoriae]|uniref:Uncharacterized protein n=1 Tax=Paenibacillus peoriae TaxID=59893 RepID=A0A7H0Y2S9_9BACL|nr:hypothetical protein [Paenibacillus peoriae]QNR65387.1 hypothetical protein IAQ67_15955 [Paenibacillus peoriae]